MPPESYRQVSQRLLDHQPKQYLDWPLQRALIRRAQAGDATALDRLIQANLRLAAREAARQACPEVPAADLVAAGLTGLRIAILRFDLTRTTRLVTFAMVWIRQCIQRERRLQRYPMVVPEHAHERLSGLYRALERLRGEAAGGDPSIADLAAAAGCGPDIVAGLLAATSPHLSLDQPGDHDERTSLLVDLLPDECAPHASARLAEDELHILLDDLLGSIVDPLDRAALAAVTGFDGQGGCTDADLARAWGVSRERIRQRRNKALTRCREVGATRTYAALAT
jgi:RNA polymerase sigma factor (sigma-70 family)